MAETRHARGLVDTSVVIDLDAIDPERLPRELAVSAITFAELVAGICQGFRFQRLVPGPWFLIRA